MRHTIRQAIASVLTTVLMLALAGGAQALPLLTLAPTQTTVAASAGASIHITGSIINRTNTDWNATDLFLNFSGFDPDVLTPSQELGLVPFSIPSFSFKDNVALFILDIAANAPPGSQALDVLLQDADGNFSDVVSFTFLVGQVVSVPEPATLALLLTLLPLLMRRRPLIHHGGHHG